jgi:hypothetical protein
MESAGSFAAREKDAEAVRRAASNNLDKFMGGV